MRRAGPPSTGAATAAAVGRISAVAARVIAVERLSRAPCCAHPSRHRNLTRRNLTRRAGSASMLALCQRVDDRGCARTGSHPDAGSDGDVLEFRVATRERRRADTGPWAFMGSCGGPCLRRSKTSFRSLQTMRCRGHPRRAGPLGSRTEGPARGRCRDRSRGLTARRERTPRPPTAPPAGETPVPHDSRPPAESDSSRSPPPAAPRASPGSRGPARARPGHHA